MLFRSAQASLLAGTEFLSRLDHYQRAWLPARSIVFSALSSRTSVHKSGRIVLFEHYAPWKEHLYELEQMLQIPDEERPWYVLYADETADAWRVQAVSVSPDSFENRKSLPEP